ncbi:hypothetical protein AVEN_244764-1 [Araneus ventricosus]|uniref:Uncharacterized protein n=1 Tax=Araneus ventricosus TaxID=182803 RepID=A0A4Y2BTK2_ARAVE|nr:hypothetical protein AVEN_244764-1 [Araneus ventricosus]
MPDLFITVETVDRTVARKQPMSERLQVRAVRLSFLTKRLRNLNRATTLDFVYNLRILKLGNDPEVLWDEPIGTLQMNVSTVSKMVANRWRVKHVQHPEMITSFERPDDV